MLQTSLFSLSVWVLNECISSVCVCLLFFANASVFFNLFTFSKRSQAHTDTFLAYPKIVIITRRKDHDAMNLFEIDFSAAVVLPSICDSASLSCSALLLFPEAARRFPSTATVTFVCASYIFVCVREKENCVSCLL